MEPRGQPGLPQPATPRLLRGRPLHVRSREPISTQRFTAEYGMWMVLRTFSRSVFSLNDVDRPLVCCRAREGPAVCLVSRAALLDSFIRLGRPPLSSSRSLLRGCVRPCANPLQTLERRLRPQSSAPHVRRWQVANNLASDQFGPNPSRPLPSPDDRASTSMCRNY